MLIFPRYVGAIMLYPVFAFWAVLTLSVMGELSSSFLNRISQRYEKMKNKNTNMDTKEYKYKGKV